MWFTFSPPRPDALSQNRHERRRNMRASRENEFCDRGSRSYPPMHPREQREGAYDAIGTTDMDDDGVARGRAGAPLDDDGADLAAARQCRADRRQNGAANQLLQARPVPSV